MKGCRHPSIYVYGGGILEFWFANSVTGGANQNMRPSIGSLVAGQKYKVEMSQTFINNKVTCKRNMLSIRL